MNNYWTKIQKFDIFGLGTIDDPKEVDMSLISSFETVCRTDEKKKILASRTINGRDYGKKKTHVLVWDLKGLYKEKGWTGSTPVITQTTQFQIM